MNKLFFALVFSLGVIGMGGGGPDWPKCENDDHCKKHDDKEVNFVCAFGQCRECARDADCKDGKTCNKKRFVCEERCSSDAMCGDGMACEAGECVKAAPKDTGKGGQSCVEDGDCESGLTCQEGICADEATAEPEATDTSTEVDCQKEARVFFAFNMHDLTPEARETLNTMATCMEQNADWRLVVEGHADERGTTEYNLQLGEKRAQAIKEYISRKGVSKDRIRTVSYGEEKPLDPASTEEAWALNRRGELVVR